MSKDGGSEENPRAAPLQESIQVSLILPAYNEVGTIAASIREAQTYFRDRGMSYEIIVAADGDDGTRELASRLALADPAIRVLGGKARRGKGRAIRSSVELADGRIIGFVDADGKTPIRELDQFLPLLEDEYDLVIGSRAIDGSVIERYQPWYRRLGSKGFGIAMHAIVGLSHVPDTQCGFKFFRRKVAKDLFGRQKVDGYMFDVETLFFADRAGYRLAQVGVRWRDDRDSRLQLVRGNLRNGIDLLSIRLRSLWGGQDRAPGDSPVSIENQELRGIRE